MLSCVNEFSSRSARMSKSRHDASSEPVAKASPLGKNLQNFGQTKTVHSTHREHLRNGVDV